MHAQVGQFNDDWLNMDCVLTLIPYLMSGTVMELSAMLVASMTFLRPLSGARKALCCSSSVTLECRGRTVRLGEGRGGRGRYTHTSHTHTHTHTYCASYRSRERQASISLISGRPGRNTSTVPLNPKLVPLLGPLLGGREGGERAGKGEEKVGVEHKHEPLPSNTRGLGEWNWMS